LLEQSLPFESTTLDPRKKKDNEKRTLLKKNHQKELDTLKVRSQGLLFCLKQSLQAQFPN
jgi:hypothetical protein